MKNIVYIICFPYFFFCLLIVVTSQAPEICGAVRGTVHLGWVLDKTILILADNFDSLHMSYVLIL